MQTSSKKNKTKANISKKKFSPTLNIKKINDSFFSKKNNKLKRKNKSISAKIFQKQESHAKRKSSSLSNKLNRSRDNSIENQKIFKKKNGKLKNIILNNSSINNINKKNKLSKKKQKNVKKEEREEKDNFWEENDSEEEKIDDEESIKSFSEMRLEYLPCRKEEQDIIYNYIKKGLQTNGNYNSLYIAGMPGTGKTASVKTIINILESELNEARNKKIIKI